TNIEGAYNIYLNVMDNEAMTRTEGWGNWAYNGTHVSPGTNPGGGTGSDFPGWWYYSKLTVDIRTPEYTLEEKHIATDSGTVLDVTKHTGITESTFTTSTQTFDGYDFVGSRAGYTWQEISGGITENIDSRTANFDSTHTNAFHYYYYKKSAPPPPPAAGKGSIVVYYKDKVSGSAVYPEDTSLTDVEYGTYTITALPAPENYTFDSVATPSPQTVTVDAGNNYKKVTFYYQPKAAPVLRPPVAVLTGPLQVMAGEDFRVDASNSYAKDGAKIVAYNWDINRYTASYPPIEPRDSRITLWSDAVEGDYCSVEVTVVDSNGLTDTDNIKIEVLPPIPTPIITITGDLRENRKVTLSAASSRTPRHFPLDTAKTRWEITPVSGGTAADIKYAGLLNGSPIKDTLYKKAGKYHIKLYVENTAGLSATAETDITINPDLPPVADFSTPATILRNPKDSNNATAIITNLSYSPDGDLIWKSAALEVYDSDNDGNFDEEYTYYSVNGAPWITTFKTYGQIKTTGFDIFSLSTSNPSTFTHKSKEVGMYIYEIISIEGIPSENTIPEFITNSDYRRNSTWE
ncbi:MAG: hypothetical protein ACYCYE_08470, partial [Clostridia bacterium]